MPIFDVTVPGPVFECPGPGFLDQFQNGGLVTGICNLTQVTNANMETSTPPLLEYLPFQNPAVEAAPEAMEPQQQPHQQEISLVSTAEISSFLDQFTTDGQFQNGGLVTGNCNLTLVTNANTEAPSLIQNPEVEAEPKTMEVIDSIISTMDSVEKETAPPPAPQEFSLVNSLANLSAENYNEHIPQILEVMQPAPISNNQMAKILDQNSGGGLVNFLSNMKTMQDVSKTQETKGTKRRPETLVNTEGQLLSNSVFLSKGGPKASNKGQNKVADFDLLSDHTKAVLNIVESLEANPPGLKQLPKFSL